MLSEAVRVEPKGFFQRRPDGAGGHIYDRQGVRRVPYRLSELIAAQTESPVFVPEGEKDVDQLVALGLTATCNPEGAGKWRSDYNAHFEGRDVFVLPDNDDPGLRHAIQVAESLGTVASSVRIVPLPDLPDGGDVSDWLEAGGTREELLELAVGAPEYRPTGKANVNGAKPYPEMPDGADHLTDLGNAKRLVAQYGQDFHYVYPFKSFLSWGETHWRQEDSGRISAMAKATVMGMYQEAAGLYQQAADAEANGDKAGGATLSSKAKDVWKWAKQSEAAPRIASMLELVKSEPGVPITPAQLDADPWLFNAQNGTIDLRSGQLRPHRREDLITKLAPVEYDPEARLDLWDRFLNEAIPDDPTRRYIQRAAGATAAGVQTDDLIMFLHGPGGTGKSTLREALVGAFGDYGATADLETFTTRLDAHSPSPDLARLAGQRLVGVSEVEGRGRGGLSLLKRVSGGDTVHARFNYGNTFDFTPQFTIWIVGNERPHVSDLDSGAWRRIREIPFQARFAKPDTSIRLTLRDPKIAGPAVLAWTIAGCLAWQSEGLGDIPTAIADATRDYRESMNPLSEWLEERTEIRDEWTAFKALFADYRSWAEGEGIRKPLGSKTFSNQLTEYFAPERQGKGGTRGFRGIVLR